MVLSKRTLECIQSSTLTTPKLVAIFNMAYGSAVDFQNGQISDVKSPLSFSLGALYLVVWGWDTSVGNMPLIAVPQGVPLQPGGRRKVLSTVRPFHGSHSRMRVPHVLPRAVMAQVMQTEASSPIEGNCNVFSSRCLI